MNQKGFINIAIIGVMVIVLGVAGYFALMKKLEPTVKPPSTTILATPDAVTPTISPIITPSPSVPVETRPQVKYQVFQSGLGNKEILNSIYLPKNDILPKEVKADLFLVS